MNNRFDNHPFNKVIKTKKKSSQYNRWCMIRQQINKGFPMYKPWYDNFTVFLLWCAQNGYKSDLQLVRKDKTKGYYPDNCYFAENSSINPKLID